MAVEVSQGVCDLCGAPSDASLQECNWLTCTFQHCEGGLYHQECLEKYLKSNKLEKNRKTGFKCPRGCGKGTRFDQACPGRIDKSHPIHPRNEDKKKTKLAAVVVEPQRPAKPAAQPVQNGKAAKGKDESCAGKDAKSTAAAKATPAPKAATPAAAVAASAPAAKAGKKEPAALPPRPEVVEKKKIAELAAQARRELGLPSASTSGLASHGSKGDLQGLTTGSAGPSKPAAAVASAWGKPSAPAPEPQPVSPQPTMMSQLPQLQQLLQQAVGKKAAAAKPTSGAAAAPAAQASKPAPAVPQPVLNPPTPVWPALGTAQPSAAALFTSASVSSSSGLTPRESTPRPGSPPSAWGSTTTTPAAATQPTAQQQQQQQSAAASTPTASTSSAASKSAGATAVGAAAASGPAPGAPAAPASAASGVGAGASTSVAAAAASDVSGSGRSSAADMQQLASSSSAAAAVPAVAAAAAGASAAASGSRSGSQLVGADFADDEGKEQKLTKSQKKNLKRTENKKKVPSASSLEQSQGDAGQDSADGAAGGSADGAGTSVQHTGASATATAAATAAARADSRLASAAAAAAATGAAAAGSSSGVHRRHVSRGSDDPEHSHIVDAEEAAVMEELCINCIVARKVLSLITQLQRLGALEFVAAAAVQRHGSNLLAALEWLLVAGVEAASKPPESVLAAAAESASAAESEVDIADELQQLNDLQAAMGVPTELLQQCVLDCNGDVQTAATTAVERMLAAPSASGTSLCGDGRVSSSGNLVAAAAAAAGAQRGGVGGGGSSVHLGGSASFYSVSSLDGAAGAEAPDAVRKPQQQQQQRQQPSSSSHFGVRLQDDEPVASGSGGGGDGGGAYSSGGPVSYAAGLLRGGVVLGAAAAAGWPNGYAPAAAAAGLGAGSSGSSRSTSRLMHWLGDDTGRAAALEEEPGSSRIVGSGAGAGLSGALGVGAPGVAGLLGTADPVLDSPFAASHGDMARSLATGKAASDSPSLQTWLGGNGYHPPGISMPGHASAAAAAVAAAPAGAAGAPHELYGGPGSNGNFSFMSGLSKPSSVVGSAAQHQQIGSMEQQYGGYGSRWAGLAGTGAAGAQLYGGAAALASDAESLPHNDGDNDLSSIMALINVR